MVRKLGSLSLVILLFVGCGKKPSPTPIPPTPTEENIVFTIDPDPGTATASATSATYAFKVNISSKLPTAGVKIDYTTKKDSDNSIVDGPKTLNSTISVVDISVSSLAASTLYNVTVVVTSASKSTNTATKTFKVARK